MLKELINLANHLDKKGLKKEADYLDGIIRKTAFAPILFAAPEALAVTLAGLGLEAGGVYSWLTLRDASSKATRSILGNIIGQSFINSLERRKAAGDIPQERKSVEMALVRAGKPDRQMMNDLTVGDINKARASNQGADYGVEIYWDDINEALDKISSFREF
jgi:hypothetical protein